MNIDINLIERVADVARLELNDEEKEQFLKDFKDILEAFSKMDECETDDTTNTSSIAVHPVPLKDETRDDISKESLSKDLALSNAKNVKDGYFKGPSAL